MTNEGMCFGVKHNFRKVDLYSNIINILQRRMQTLLYRITLSLFKYWAGNAEYSNISKHTPDGKP